MKISDIHRIQARLDEPRWLDAIPEMPGLRLQVRGLGSTACRHAEDRVMVGANLPDGEGRQAAIDRLDGMVLADGVLVDWDGLTNDEDQPVPYSHELARQLCTDPATDRFRLAVRWAAREHDRPAA